MHNDHEETCGQEYQLLINQQPTGTPQEWRVLLLNATPCILSNIKLECKDFQSRIAIDPKLILKQGDVCIVKSGHSINPQDSLHFVYSWDEKFPFKVANESLAC